MGYGDELLGSGIAKLAARRGKRVAFGDGVKVLWNNAGHQIYKNNPNVVRPGDDLAALDVEWCGHYPGRRLYHRGREGNRWIYNPNFRPEPGEIYFTDQERAFGEQIEHKHFIVIEPMVKRTAPNKQWPVERYRDVAKALRAKGHEVIQFDAGIAARPLNIATLKTASFRHAASALARAALFIGPEGGLHHAAAALGVPAVVIFGGFTHPRNTGYAIHENIFIGDEPCGQINPCRHCKDAMHAITVERVLAAAEKLLSTGGATHAEKSGWDLVAERRQLPDQISTA